MSGRGYTIFDTMIGRCGIAWGHGGIAGVQLPEAREIETRRRLYQLYPDAREQRPTPNVEIAIEGIVALLRGQPADLTDIVLDMAGIHAFNQRVYQVTQAIPRGETRTYGEIAKAIGRPGAARAVGLANHDNPIAVVIPCHRVLGRDGSLTGYAGGIHLKAQLLSIERRSRTLFT